MTCIAAMETVNGVEMWADCAGVQGQEILLRSDPKIGYTRDGRFLIGFTSSFRMGQSLIFELQVASEDCGSDDPHECLEFMVRHFIPAARRCLAEAGYAKKESNVEEGGVFLVAYRGRLFFVDSDFHSGGGDAGGGGVLNRGSRSNADVFYAAFGGYDVTTGDRFERACEALRSSSGPGRKVGAIRVPYFTDEGIGAIEFPLEGEFGVRNVAGKTEILVRYGGVEFWVPPSWEDTP